MAVKRKKPLPPGIYTMRLGKKGFEAVNAKKRKPKPDPYGRPWRAVLCYDPEALYVTNAQDEALFVTDTKLARLIVKAVNTYKGKT